MQLALDPDSYKYYIIEVNPRVSRSSALASKATGYPIAKIAAKIAVGLTLDEIRNPVTLTTYAQFEPALDYVVAKIPRWPFDKFEKGDRRLGTQMKATGEVMAIGRNIEESLLKAVRSLELGIQHVRLKDIHLADDGFLINKLVKAQDDRLFYLVEALRRGYDLKEIHSLTKIDCYFLDKLLHIVELEKVAQSHAFDAKVLRKLKTYGFCDSAIAELWKTNTDQVEVFRKGLNILPVYKMVDTCAGEFASSTPYFYATYEAETESFKSGRPSIVVLGSGPIRIGQGIEFDYATVHCVKAIRKAGYEAIIINSNPETVSTDFSIADKLYFEPLTLEDVMHILELEKPIGVIVQFGGQTAINLAAPLSQKGIKILGTRVEDLDRAEDRKAFEKALRDLCIPQPLGAAAINQAEAIEIATRIGYPVLCRPSYVIGGRAMEIIEDESILKQYIQNAVQASSEHPVLIDRYLQGKECEVDAICDGETVLIPGIMEHIEGSGIHSGDSMAVYPPQTLSQQNIDTIVDYTHRLAIGLKCIGMMNVQFIIHQDEVVVIEVNPRSSRTVPFLSKVTDIPMAQIATRVILGEKLDDMGYKNGLAPLSTRVHVKAPVFSFAKLRKVDTNLGPEMKSTGEVMGSDNTLDKALYKAFAASGYKLLDHGTVLFTIEDAKKNEAMKLARRFLEIGYALMATPGTAEYFRQNGLTVIEVMKIHADSDLNILELLRKNKISLVINILSHDRSVSSDGFLIRREAVEHGIPQVTSIDTAKAIVQVLESRSFATQSL